MPQATSTETVRQLCERYGLQSDPFADAPERFFDGGQRQQSLDYLRHLASFGDLPLTIAGEPGVGRSRLLAEFCRVNKNHLDIRQLRAEQCRTVRQLAQVLWGFFRSGPTMPSDPVMAVTAFFANDQWLTFGGKRWVLVLDDADQVPLEVLETLMSGAANSGGGPKAPVPLIVGSNMLADALQKSCGAALYRVMLRPLNPDESSEYIKLCFQWAGGDPSGVLDGRRANDLYVLSGGYFDRLKQVAPEVILAGRASKGVPTVTAPARKRGRQALLLTSALALLGISYAIVSWQYQDARPELSQSEPLFSPDTTEVERVRQAMESAERSIRSESAAPEPREVKTVAEGATGGETAATLPANPPLLPESLGLSIKGLLAARLAQPVVSALPEEGGVPEPEPGVVAPAVVDVEEGEAAPAASTEGDGFQPRLAAAFRDRYWVEGIPAGSFTIQLLGGYSEDSAVRLVRNHPSVGLFYVRSTYRGKPWFVVIHGIYASRDLARADVDTLPLALRRDPPWIRETDGL